MQKNSSQINYIFTKFLVPFFLTFTLYIQVFGEIGPGGGFQAGALFASSIIAYDISISKINFSSRSLVLIGTIGFAIYLSTGIISFFKGNNFLNYYSISKDIGQSFGIMIIELGVGICVSSVMFLIYQEFRDAD
jgi:multicomponent Na+:H+ antiporter subunit B